MDETAARWRAALMESLPEERDLPLLLSGGMDSMTLLAALLERGDRPPAFTYRLEGVPSRDVDAARDVARDEGLPLCVVVLRRSPAAVDRDVRAVLRVLRRPRRTAVQCAVPILHLARAVGAFGRDAALVGTGGIVEDNAATAILAAQSEEAARKVRAESLRWRGTGNATEAMHQVAEVEGVTLREPYATDPLASLGLSLDVAELNRPTQKGIAARAFPGFFADRRRRSSRNAPLQVAGGVRALHEGLYGTEPAVHYANVLAEEEGQSALF